MAGPTDRYLPIQDYAIVGDCGSAALVSRHGSIDWLCWPRFDSPSIFAALLDADKGGSYIVRPTAPYDVTRRYVGDTNVLETTFTTATGVLRLTDLMTVVDVEPGQAPLQPDHELLRGLECVEGEVDVEVVIAPRFDYGRRTVRVEDRGRMGCFWQYDAQVVVVRSEIPLEHDADRGALVGHATLTAGERCMLAMTYDVEEPALLPLLGEAAWAKLATTIAYWEGWIGQCRYDGPFRDAVVRSALTLKLMTYARSGAIVAAPTTSLPEALGGERNWDYRYCWLRDAAFTLRAFFELGYDEEGDAFFHWLLHAIGGRQPSLHIFYDVNGVAHVGERELEHLEGYKGSRPVRIGNGAQDQFQLDVYGEVLCAAYEYVQRRDSLEAAHRRLLQRLGQVICERWREPDEGIWEVRGGRRQHTYSKAMCWAGLDRLIDLCERGYLEAPNEDLHAIRDEIREAIETHGFNEELGSYTATFGGDRVDASLLLMAVYGYQDAAHERMQGTFRCIQERLGVDGLLYRYRIDDGFDSEENAFGICSFWDEAFLALSGDLDAAEEHLRQTLSYANDLLLFAEEIDPATRDHLGNFPQAFTHVGLINAALTIDHLRQEGHGPAVELSKPIDDPTHERDDP